MSSATRYLTLIGASSLILSSGAMGAAVSLSANLASFNQALDFDLVATDVAFRFSEVGVPAGDNNSTHILIDGLVPIESGSAVLTSSYRGVDIETGTEYDFGQVYLELPTAPSGDGASSPIVGIVSRSAPTGSSGWSAYTPTGVMGALDGASGSIDFDDEDDSGMMAFSFSAGSSTFTGMASYDLVDAMTIDVGGFDLSDGTTTYSVAPFQLVEMDGEWYSFLLTDATDYDSIMYELRVTSTVGVPTWANFISLGNTGDGRPAWYSWHFKYVFEGPLGSGFSGDSNIYWIADFNRWVYFDTNSGLGSLEGFWMYIFNLPGVSGAGSWVYLGTSYGSGAFGRLDDLEPSGGYADIDFVMYAAADGTFYYFTEYEDAGEYPGGAATAGNYFQKNLDAGSAQYFKVQEPLNDITGVEIQDGDLPAPPAP